MKQLEKIGNNTLWKILFCLVFFANTISSFFMIYIFQNLIDAALAFDEAGVIVSVKQFTVTLTINLIFLVLDQYSFRSLSAYGEMNLKKYTFYNYLLYVASPENRNVGKSVSKINSDIPIISSLISKGRLNTYLQIIYLAFCLILMLYYSRGITIVIILLITVVFGFSRYFSIKESESTKDLQNSYEKISAKIYNNFQNLRTIRQLGTYNYSVQKMKELSLNSTKKQIKNLATSVAVNEALLSLMTDILPMFAFFLGIMRCSVGTGLSLMIIAQKLNEPIIVLAELLAENKNAKKVYERIQDIYGKIDEKNMPNKNFVSPFREFNIIIEKFNYGNSEDVVIKNMNLLIEKDDLWVIKGESGSGKSTLVKIIAGFIKLKSEQGIVNYNKENIQELCPNEYYHHVLLVEQDAIIIEGSLRDNLLLGDDFLEKDIEDVMYICGLNEFYKENGEDYIIKENGKNISGGEKQRINLARILLRKPEVLILDEATSNLDKELREKIISRLMIYKKNKQITLLAVSHNNDFDCYNPKHIRCERTTSSS